jgi:flagellar hook protein FlgE
MSFGQGLSGLDAASQNLDIIGNNIANSGTVGFKSASATFADVYASSRVGLGVKVASINQRFTVGNVAAGGQYDIAIDGANGFFRMADQSGAISYTRNGQFTVDKNNNIVNASGYHLTGFTNAGVGTAPVNLVLPQANIPPQATGTAGFIANLNANATPVPTATAFDPANSDTYTDVQPMTVYDSLGNSHQLNQYFTKRPGVAGPPSQSVYEVNYTLDGTAMTPANSTMTFDSTGALTSAPIVNVGFTFPATTASPAAPLAVAINYTGTTQFGSAFGTSPTPDGYASGEFTTISIDKDGTIVASYTNGQTQPVGMVALADFNNVQGLQPVGDNAWIETSASGGAVLGQPGTNGLATLRGQAVEESNVDLSNELVNLIVAQRTYQANTQSIKTQDEVLQSLIQIG